MKKVISISLTLLMLMAVLHLTIATHYCSGKVAASKISLSGKLASCGMESDDQAIPPTGSFFTTHCCSNVLVHYGINSTYFPSFSFIPESYQVQLHVFSVPASLIPQSMAFLKSSFTSMSPPYAPAFQSVDLSDICVYRI